MPAAAPEHAPRPRLASWLIAGAVVAAITAGLAAAAWWGLPSVAPEWVCAHSPWVDPAVRAAMEWESQAKFNGQIVLMEWVGKGPGRKEKLVPYLASPSSATRVVVTSTIASIGLPNSRAMERALLSLLDDPDSGLRQLAAWALTDPGSIPVLEAHRGDSVGVAAEAVEGAIRRLRNPPPASSPGR